MLMLDRDDPILSEKKIKNIEKNVELCMFNLYQCSLAPINSPLLFDKGLRDTLIRLLK